MALCFRGSAIVPGLILLAASCSYDLDGFTPSGGTSNAGGAAASSTGAGPSTTSTTSATTGSTSASGGAPATSTTDATSTSVATSSVSSSASSGTGGAGPLAFCDTGNAPLVDDFDAPSIDTSKWQSFGTTTEETNHVRMKISSNMSVPVWAYLTPAETTSFTGDCALTVNVIPATNGFTAFGVGDGNGADLHIQYFGGNLSVLGGTATINAMPPFSLALVSHGGSVYAAADTGQGWQLLAGPVPSPAWAAQAHVAFGQFGDQTSYNSRFDNFDIATISLADLGL